MDKWQEHVFDNLSRLIANERKSKAASVSPNPNQYRNVIPIAITYSSGMITRSKAASSSRVGYHEDGSIAWTRKTTLRTTPADDFRALMFGQK
jgi:hypothetical protein